MKQKTKEKNKSTKEKAPETTALAKPLSDPERQLLEAFIERDERAKKLPVFKSHKPTTWGLSGIEDVGVSWERICSLLKTDHQELAAAAISSAVSTGPVKDPDTSINLVMQQFSALQPQSYLETMLIAQMIQVSNAASKCMGLVFVDGQTTYGKELNANLATKFQRTFIAQIEALQKLRGKGGQKVTVEHVHVHQGGQAIVGNVEQGEG